MLTNQTQDVCEPADAPPGGQAARLTTALMDAVECGLIACDPAGNVLYANRAAEKEIGPDSGLRQEGTRLGTNGPVRCTLNSAIRDSASRGVRRLLWVGQGADRLMLSTIPVRGALGSDAVMVLVVLGRRRLCSPLGLELLAMGYHLTAAEKRVLGALTEARETRQIAKDGGVQLSTVRSHIHSIRSKFGARSIDEVLLRVAQVPAVAAAPTDAMASSSTFSGVSSTNVPWLVMAGGHCTPASALRMRPASPATSTSRCAFPSAAW
jgi:DNA-binding CsgD family transcriptional regulator